MIMLYMTMAVVHGQTIRACHFMKKSHFLLTKLLFYKIFSKHKFHSLPITGVWYRMSFMSWQFYLNYILLYVIKCYNRLCYNEVSQHLNISGNWWIYKTIKMHALPYLITVWCKTMMANLNFSAYKASVQSYVWYFYIRRIPFWQNGYIIPMD